jgi:hypothetical protein
MPEPHILLSVVAGHALVEPSSERRLPGRRLALAGRQDIAHQHLIDGVGRNPAVLQRRGYRRTTQFGRGQTGELALEPGHRRPRRSSDDDGFAHLECLICAGTSPAAFP